MTTPDRLTEIRARVASYTKAADPYSTVGWLFDDLEFCLAEIERLTREQEAMFGECHRLKNGRDTACAQRERLRAALEKILASSDELTIFRIARAALEESK